jgi:hypothetical protein
MRSIQCRLLASQSRYCVGLHELYLESTECPTADFEQVQEVCSSYVLSEFYASTEGDAERLLLDATPYSELSRYCFEDGG